MNREVGKIVWPKWV